MASWMPRPPERGYRRLLARYPAAHRRVHEEEARGQMVGGIGLQLRRWAREG